MTMTHVVKLSKRVTLSQTLTVTACAHHLQGNAAPYFSVTAELRDRRVKRDDGVIACGCLHDEIAKAFPQLAPIIALHLANAVTGEPMHAVENGWYHAQGGSEKMDTLARHLRICGLEAMAAIINVRTGAVDKAQFTAWLDSMRPRWQQEALDGVALLDRLASAAD